MSKKILDNFEEASAGIILLIMASIAFINVITRYLVKYSLSFTEEIEVNLFVWLVLLGTAAGFKRGSHLAVNFLVSFFPKRIRKLIIVVGYILTASIFAILIYLGIREVMDEILLEATSESLGLPVWWYTIGVPIGSGIVIWRIIDAIIKELREDKEDLPPKKLKEGK